jgi:hypothetical protein
LADNVVEVLVQSRDQAKPDMDDLKERLAELGRQVATARADVDDEAAAAKLDDLQAKLIDLGKRAANPKITMSGAIKAEAQIHAVEASLKKLDDTAADGGPGMKARALGFAEAAASLTGLGDAMGVADPEASMFQKVMAGAGLATGLLEPVVAGVTVAVGGLASGVASAGIGLGVFAEVAKSAYSQVSGAVTAYQTAQSTTGKAAATAMAQYKADMAALTPAQRAFAGAINGAENAWQSFVAANTAGVTQILDKGLGLLPKLLASIQPLLAPVEHALSGLIGQLGKGLDSSGFKSFMSSLASNTGPAITKLGDAIGHIVTGIGGILKAFMPVSQEILGGVDKITGAFAKWGTTLSGHSGFASLMETFKTETPLAMGVLKNLVVVIKNVASAMAGVSTASNSKTLLQVLQPLSGILAALSKNQDLDRIALYLLAAADAGKKLKNTFQGIQAAMGVFKTGASMLQDFSAGFSNSAAAASEATGVWGTFGGKMASAGSSVASFVSTYAAKMGEAMAATGAWIAEHAVAAASFIAENVAMAASATAAFIAENAATLGLVTVIAALVAAIVYLALHWKQVWSDIETVTKAVFSAVKDAVTDVVDFIKSHWQLLLAILTGPIGLAALAIVKYWKDIVTGAQDMFHDVVSFFEELPKRILSLVVGYNMMLFNAGKAIIMGLVHGIESAVGDVEHAVSSVVDDIKSFLPFSPAKRGPLSGAGAPDRSGASIAAMLAQGMESGRGAVAAAASHLAGAAGVGPGGYAGTAAAAGGGGGDIVFRLGGGSGLDQMFMTWLKNSVRTGGGDPNIFTKKVKFL